MTDWNNSDAGRGATFGKAQGKLTEMLNKNLDATHKLPNSTFTGTYTMNEMRRALHGATKHIADFEHKGLSELIDAGQTGQTAKVLSTVWDAAFETNIGRQFVSVISEGKQRSVKIPVEGRPVFIEVAHGATGEGPETGKDYTFVEWSVKKFGARISISQDMIDDAAWNVVQRQLALLGSSYGEFETNRILDTMFTDAGQSVAASGTLTMAHITEAWRKFQRFPGGGTRIPTHLVISPEHYEDIAVDTAFQNLLFHRPDISGGAKEGGLPGAVGFIPGSAIQVITHPALAANTSLMIAKGTAGVLLVRQDLNIEEIDDPLRDLVHGKGSSRVEYKTIEANSILKFSA